MVTIKRQAQLQLLLAIVNAFELNFKPDEIKTMVDKEWEKYSGPFELPENPKRCTCHGTFFTPIDESVPLDRRYYCPECKGYRHPDFPSAAK